MANKKKTDDGGAETENDGPATQPFWVKSTRPQGRWRCGLQFLAEPRRVDLTEEQYNAVNDDPCLAFTPPPEGAAASEKEPA